MFERFLEEFDPKHQVSIRPLDSVITVDGWMRAAGGASFGGGLYRVHSHISGRAADDLVCDAFPEFFGRVRCFGYDWMGRQFAIDAHRGRAIDPEVLIFEPGTGGVFEGPDPFSRFHDYELVDEGEIALARSFYEEWLGVGG
ncbi:MAG: hypothetical protein ACRCWS_05945, partial [Propionibacteriaceae bacterium]